MRPIFSSCGCNLCFAQDEEGELPQLPQQKHRRERAGASAYTLFTKYPLDHLSNSPSLLPGRQLRLLRLQGAERQQRGPVQTQLPDWLEQREVGHSSDEARLVSIIQTHLKLQQRTNYCTHKIFLLKKTTIQNQPKKPPFCPAASLYKTAATNKNIQKR